MPPSARPPPLPTAAVPDSEESLTGPALQAIAAAAGLAPPPPRGTWHATPSHHPPFEAHGGDMCVGERPYAYGSAPAPRESPPPTAGEAGAGGRPAAGASHRTPADRVAGGSGLAALASLGLPGMVGLVRALASAGPGPLPPSAPAPGVRRLARAALVRARNALRADRRAEDLEFVQCLANPNYLNWLAQNRYFDDPAFLAYLKHLEYWREPPYAVYLQYPHCLAMLGLLGSPEFRTAIGRAPTAEFVHSQQLWFWQWWQANRAGEVAAASAVTAAAGEVVGEVVGEAAGEVAAT